MKSQSDYQNKTFRLINNIINGELKIVLYDFNQWTIYEKSYSEDDSGLGEIHKKMDIKDIQSSFNQITSQSDEKEAEEKQRRGHNIGEYKYGTILKYNDIPCYKVQKRGQITVYHTIIDQKTKKDIIYQSKLNLIKSRELDEQEISKQKQRIEKRQTSIKITKDLTSLKQQNLDLNKKMKKMEKQFHKLQDQIANLINKLNQVEHVAHQHCRTLFQVNGNQVKYIGENDEVTQYIFNKPIPRDQKYIFQISMSPNENNLYIGVINYQQQKYNRISEQNYIDYHYKKEIDDSEQEQEDDSEQEQEDDSEQEQEDDSEQEQEEDRQKLIVKVVVNFEEQKIQWYINDNKVHEQIDSMLGDETAIFKPFVTFVNKGSSVQWIEEI